MTNNAKDEARQELNSAMRSGVGPKAGRLALAVLSGIPGWGGLFGAAGAAWSEAEQDQFKRILAAWIKLQEDEIKEIGVTMLEVMTRVDKTDERVRQRIESPEYLSLIKKCFRDWSASESEEKRTLVRNLLANAASAEKICGDDILRLFVEWIDRYSEGHFKIVRTIQGTPGLTRAGIWTEIDGRDVRDDSADADLFNLMIHDLSVGRVIRQHREVDYQGRVLKAKRSKPSSSPYRKSPFDDEKEYELTELGRWFVSYTMNELVPKIAHQEATSA